MKHVLKFTPAKREAILYTRVTPENKKFVEELAANEKVSESALVDHIIMLFRTAHAGEQKKS